METPEALQQRVRRDQQLYARLRLATTRLADAECERIWAIVAAKEAGLSLRQIARATGLSPTRIHQLLQADEAREIPVWLSQLQDHRLTHAVDPEADPLGRRGRGPPLVHDVAGAVGAGRPRGREPASRE